MGNDVWRVWELTTIDERECVQQFTIIWIEKYFEFMSFLTIHGIFYFIYLFFNSLQYSKFYDVNLLFPHCRLYIVKMNMSIGVMCKKKKIWWPWTQIEIHIHNCPVQLTWPSDKFTAEIVNFLFTLNICVYHT